MGYVLEVDGHCRPPHTSRVFVWGREPGRPDLIRLTNEGPDLRVFPSYDDAEAARADLDLAQRKRVLIVEWPGS